MKNTGLIVKTKTNKKGLVYYKSLADLQGPKLQVHVIDANMKKTGEKLLCNSKTLTAVGYLD